MTTAVAYLGYGRHGTCHGRHFEGGAKIAWQIIEIYIYSLVNLYFEPHTFINCKAASTPRAHINSNVLVERVVSAPPNIHRCRGRQSFWRCKRFLPDFPQNCPKSFCAIFAYKFYSTKIVKTFFGITPKKRLSCIFLQTLGAIFWNQTTLGAISARFPEILPKFSGILPGFSTTQNFWGWACIPASYTTAKHYDKTLVLWQNTTVRHCDRTRTL